MLENIFYEIYNNIYNFLKTHQFITIILIDIGFLGGMEFIDKVGKIYKREEERYKK